MAQKLYKVTIVIWSDEDPRECDLECLAREATSGGMYSPSAFPKFERIDEPEKDPDWEDTEFFSMGEDDEDESSTEQ